MTALQTWHARLLPALDTLSQLPAVLEAPPAGGDPSERLRLLAEVWQRFAPNPSDLNPGRTRAERWTDRVAGTREDLAGWFYRAILGTERAIAEALDGGATHEALIRTGDFGQGVRTIDSGQRFAGTGRPLLLAAGVVAALPDGHRLRAALPAEDFLLLDGREPALALGPLYDLHRPREWYWAAEALRLTRDHRSAQVRKAEAEARERLRLEQDALRNRQAELGRLRRVLERLG
jgi:hypothetical protein